MNSIISWIGGKKALRKLIYQRLPVSYGRYIEVFGGGGWVLFGKTPEGMEVYNDYNRDLTNLFRCVRDRPLAMIKELGFFPLNGREEFEYLKKFLRREEFVEPDPWLMDEDQLAHHYLEDIQYNELKPLLVEKAQVDDVKRAASFYKLIRYSYGSGCTSFSCQPFNIRKTFGMLWEGSRRLTGTVIENKDFEALIRHYDREDAFFYCDPPYFRTEGHYDVVFKTEDHVRLRAVLGDIHGKWLLSYNDCPYIREMYEGYQIETVSRIDNLAQRYRQGKEYAEVFISNYDTTRRIREIPEQIELSDVYQEYM